MLRVRRHVFRIRGGGLDQDGLRQGERSCPRRSGIHRIGRQLLPYASERLRRAHRRPPEVHPYRPDPEWSQRMSTEPKIAQSEPGMLHPELLAEEDRDAIYRGGKRLDNAEGSSKPL